MSIFRAFFMYVTVFRCLPELLLFLMFFCYTSMSCFCFFFFVYRVCHHSCMNPLENNSKKEVSFT